MQTKRVLPVPLKRCSSKRDFCEPICAPVPNVGKLSLLCLLHKHYPDRSLLSY